MMTLFIILQCTLLFFMLFHDWLPVPPLNDIAALKRDDSFFHRLLGSMVNGVFVFIPLMLTLTYSHSKVSLSTNIIICGFYFILTIGSIFSWWVPYFFGSSEKHKEHFSKFKSTHHFLPPIEDNVIPNTLHVILHLQVWACLALSVYFLASNFGS